MKIFEGLEEINVRKHFVLSLCVLASAIWAAGCSSANNSNTANTNTDTTTTSTTTTTNATATAPDNSEIAVTNNNGTRTETRTFKSGRVERVVVTTTPEGHRTARVYARDSGEPRELPEDKVGDALSATGDALASAAGWTADKTVEGAKAVKNGAGTVADKTAEGAQTVGEKTAEGAKTVGQKTAEGAKTVGHKTAEGAKKAGSAVKKAVTP
jgi:hypothetical protein